MKDFEMFEKVYDVPLKIGLHVVINPIHILFSDYPDEYVIIGINWDVKRRKTIVTIEKNWVMGGIGEWSPLDLLPL